MSKTIFGVILAAFLMMSVSWIAPVNVQAAEINKKEILENTNDLINSLMEEKDSLLTIIEDSETTEIVSQLLEAETDEDRMALILEYQDLVESKYADELAALESSSLVYINNLQDLLSGVTIDSDDGSDSPTYYKITKTPSSVKVTKTESEEINDNEVLFRVSDGSVKINILGWLEDLFNKLSIIFGNLAFGLLGVINAPLIILLIIELFAVFLKGLGFEEIALFIINCVAIAALSLELLVLGLMLLSGLFTLLAELVSNSKEKTSETRLSVFKNKLYQLLEKVFLFFENIKAQSTF